MGIGSMVRIVAPLIGGATQSYGGLVAISQLCASLCLVMALCSALLMESVLAGDKPKQR